MTHEVPLAPQAETALIHDERYLEAAATMTRLTGLGIQELSQEISFNGNSGRLLDAIQDEKCPIGGWFKEAHAADQQAVETGEQTAGDQKHVTEKLTGISMLLGKSIELSEQTTALNRGDITIDDMYSRTNDNRQQEKPDFLA